MTEFNAELRLPTFRADPPHDGRIEVDGRTAPDPAVVQAAREHIEAMQLQRELDRLCQQGST